MADVKVDHVSFNADHWSKKTEKEFVEDGLATGNHPVGASKEEATAWLKKAYAAVKEASAPKKAEEAPAAK